MGPAPRTAFSWKLLQEELGSSFTARSRNLLGSKFTLLSPEGKEFGRLRLRGISVAEFESRDYAATLERSGKNYRMVAGGEEVLTAIPRGRSIGELEISCGGRNYEAKASYFRNSATASYPDGEKAVRLSGGLTNRSYEAFFATEDTHVLPVAVFLLWHLVTNRRRVYRMGSPREGAEM